MACSRIIAARPVSGLGEQVVREMGEGLRLSYLSAMGIQVWVPREKCADARAAVETQKDRPAAEMYGLREILGSSTAAESPPRPLVSVATKARDAAAHRAAESFVLAVAGSCLFVDRNPARRDAAACSDLLAALAFVLERRRSEVQTEVIDWPSEGPLSEREQMRDALTARIRKLAQRQTISRVVLMGSAATALLLDWSDEQFSTRSPVAQRIADVEQPVLVTLGVTQLLRDPLSKRETWQDLRHAAAQ